MPHLNSRPSGGPLLLAQAGRDGLVNYEFILEAPWKACRLCGTVYQSTIDRECYELAQQGYIVESEWLYAEATRRRERWLKLHNRRKHAGTLATELRQLELSGLPVTPEAAGVLSTYGIIPIGPTPYEDEISSALLEAPRAPVDDVEG